jgi:predicted MFS family arabinose efflux permease
LATTGFLALLTEIIPAGTIVMISASLGVSEPMAGQLITLYAVGSLLAAVPLMAATVRWRRRRLLICVLAVLFGANVITAGADNLYLILGARFVAGVAGAMIWGMLAGYARRLVADHLKGRALAVASLGTPLALAVGVPLGTWLGGQFGWRFAFIMLAVLTLGAMVWVVLKVPEYPGQAAGRHASIARVFVIPGIRPVLAVLMLWVLAHTMLYTYIVPFLAPSGMADQSETVLLAFGLAALAGIWLTGALIDRHLRRQVLLCLAVFALAALILGFWRQAPQAVYIAVVLWGLTFGGSPTLLQTALAEAAGEHADVGQAMLVTSWNIAIAAGGMAGGVLLDTRGPAAFPWTLLMLIAAAIVIAWKGGRHGFTSRTSAYIAQAQAAAATRGPSANPCGHPGTTATADGHSGRRAG